MLQFPLKSRCAHMVLTLVLATLSMSRAADVSISTQTFEAASQKAAAENRLILLEFFSKNSAESKMLRERLLASAPVNELLSQRFVVVSVEVERQSDPVRHLGVSHPGVFVIVNVTGTEVDRIAGSTTPDQFVQFLEAGIAGRSLLDSTRQKATAPDAGVQAHLALAQAYVKRRQPQLALQEFAWCLEQGPSLDPHGYRRYLTAVIAQVKVLSASLPAAKTLLLAQQTKLWTEAKKNPSAANYRLLFKLNTALKQSSRNIESYLALPADASFRGQLFGDVFPALVEQRKYREAATAVDLETFVGRAYPLVPAEFVEGAQSLDGDQRDPEELRRQHIADLTVPAVEVLLGAGFPEKARRIAGRAMDSDSSRHLKVRLIEAAQRAIPNSTAFTDWIKTYQQSAPGVVRVP